MSDASFTDFEFEADRLHEMVKDQHHKLDSALHVQFYKHAELDTFKSTKQGRKVYEEFLYVRILAPANRLNIIERRATDEDRRRFASQFRAFMEKGESLQLGTPLDQLPSLNAAQVLELRSLKVETVEQLAAMSDGVVQLLGTGGQTMKQAAIKYLDRAADGETLSAENRVLKKELEELQARMRALEEAKSATAPTVTTTAKA